VCVNAIAVESKDIKVLRVNGVGRPGQFDYVIVYYTVIPFRCALCGADRVFGRRALGIADLSLIVV